MEFSCQPGPAPISRTPSTIAVSMTAIDTALTELVGRMERDIAQHGTISRECASELRSLRIGAEQLLCAQTDTSLAF